MTFSALDGQTIGVWGAGAETRSFARHVAQRLPLARIAVLIIEDGDGVPTGAPELTEIDGLRIARASDAATALHGCQALIRSPGVSIHRPELVAARAAGITVATATGLWLAERRGRNVLGITATKGKSTTAAMTEHLIRAAGRAVHLAGNIGPPALDLLDAADDDLVVLELSSYQIADLAHGPQVAMAFNLYPEHLDWHGSHEAYAREKLRLLNLPGVERCVVNARSPEVMAAPRAGGPVFAFGEAPGWHVLSDGSIARGDVRIDADHLPLLGPANALNICGALTALDALDVALPPLPAAFDGFAALAHRLQTVHQAGGVTWVDDSISTTPQSTQAALEAFHGQPIVLLGGGFDRGQDYAALAATLAAADVQVIGLPGTGARLVEAAHAAGVSAGRAVVADDLAEAVELAHRLAQPGATVLLSPAAPSYNTHRNYAARGDEFRDRAVALSMGA